MSTPTSSVLDHLTVLFVAYCWGFIFGVICLGGPNPEPPVPLTADHICVIRTAEWGSTTYETLFTPWGHTRWNDWNGFWRIDGDVLILNSTGPCNEWRIPLKRGPGGILTGIETRGVEVSMIP